MLRKWNLLLLSGIFWASVSLSFAGNWYYDRALVNQCEQADGNTIFADYQYDTQMITIQNKTTHEVLFELERLDAAPVYLREWSPDCRYLIGQVDAAYVVWDTVNRTRVATTNALPKSVYRSSYLSWENGGWWLLGYNNYSRYTGAVYLWDVAQNRVVPIIPISALATRTCSFEQWKLDAALGDLWAFEHCGGSLSSVSYLRRYSLADGHFVAEYPVGQIGKIATLDFRVTANGEFLVTSQFGSNYVKIYRRDGTLVGNLHTLHTYLPQHALSPDGRFYVIVQNQLRVWDLTQLTPDATENLTFEGSDRVMTAVRFLDGTTVETTNVDGVIQRWNVLTGELLP